MLEKKILITHGEKKGTQYLLNPVLFENAKIGITPSLKTMEPYRLEALIREDLQYNNQSRMSDIKSRLDGVPEADIQKSIYKMVREGAIIPIGAKKNRTYELAKLHDGI